MAFCKVGRDHPTERQRYHQSQLGFVSITVYNQRPSDISGLTPILPNDRPTRLIDDSLIPIIKKTSELKPRIGKVISALVDHEARFPPQDPVGIFARMARDDVFSSVQIPKMQPVDISAYMSEAPPLALFDVRSHDHLECGPMGFSNWLDSDPFAVGKGAICYGGQHGSLWAALPVLRFVLWEALWLANPDIAGAAKTCVTPKGFAKWIDILIDKLLEQLAESTTELEMVYKERRVRGETPIELDVDDEANRFQDDPISPTGSHTPRSSGAGSQHPADDMDEDPELENTVAKPSDGSAHSQEYVEPIVTQVPDLQQVAAPAREGPSRARSPRASKSWGSMTEAMAFQGYGPNQPAPPFQVKLSSLDKPLLTPIGQWGNPQYATGWFGGPRTLNVGGPEDQVSDRKQYEEIKQRLANQYFRKAPEAAITTNSPQVPDLPAPPFPAGALAMPSTGPAIPYEPRVADSSGASRLPEGSRKRKKSPPDALNVAGMSDELEPEHGSVPAPQGKAVSNSFMNPPSDDSLFRALDDTAQISTPHAPKRAVRSSARVAPKTAGSKSGSEAPDRAGSASTSRSQSGMTSYPSAQQRMMTHIL
ncbi:hypothetical protein BDV93DRAFT_316186 [Ceratobasidium sp. AG-I]|nr:hypothetical protein BDV93DRAFT_316186 [Ceratobasidium sp. AG-I]